MAKKRKAIHRHREHREPTPPPAMAEPPVFASPFKDLKKLIEQRAAELKSKPTAAQSAPPRSAPAGTANGRSARPELSVATPAAGISTSRRLDTPSAALEKPTP